MAFNYDVKIQRKVSASQYPLQGIFPKYPEVGMFCLVNIVKCWTESAQMPPLSQQK